VPENGSDVAASQIVLELAHLGGELAFPGLEPLLELGDIQLGLLELGEPELGLRLELGRPNVERAFALVEQTRPLGSLFVGRPEAFLEAVDAAPLGLEQLLDLLDARLALREPLRAFLDRLDKAFDTALQLVVLRLVDAGGRSFGHGPLVLSTGSDAAVIPHWDDGGAVGGYGGEGSADLVQVIIRRCTRW
jgi:hypothetical protein